MIRVNCKQLVQVLTEMRRALGVVRNSPQPVSITADRKVATVRLSIAEASIACQFGTAGGDGFKVPLTLPLRSFSTIPNLAKQVLTITPDADEVRLEWTNSSGIKSSVTEKVLEHRKQEVNVGLNEPEWIISNDCQLGRVLSNAASISDPGSLRYSLGCVRLRGSDGQVAATDGRQAYAVSGFSLPLDEVLVPGEVLSRLNCIRACDSISVGRSPDWLSIRCGVGPVRWLVDLKIRTDGRFPNVDQCMPHESASRCRVRISDHDAQYLLRHLDRLVGKSDELNPVTLDLNRDRVLGKPQVQLRFRSVRPELETSDWPTIELSLDSSTSESVAMRVAFDHHFLLTALRFGFREIHLPASNHPAFCVGRNQRFVWTCVHEGLCIGPTPMMQAVSTSQALIAA